MKISLALILGASVGFTGGSFMAAHRLNARHAAQLVQEQLRWQAEKAEIEAALAEAMTRPPVVTVPATAGPAAPPVPGKLSPGEIVTKLRAVRSAPATDPRTARQVIYWLEDLITAGAPALPAIREFLVRNEDIDFDFASPPGRGGRSGSVANDFILPPSLRFGLLDVVKRIGGVEGENLLAEVLGTTGRGVELSWLARSLQDIAPNKYRDVALSAARELLARSPGTASSSPLDRNDRDNLFGVLTMYGDSSYASSAQAQLVRPDGQVDRSGLRYLQQALGPQAVAIAAQLYEDPRLSDPATREPLARLALNYVGAEAQANDFYQKAINDLALSKDHRRNLIEDLNQDGFADTRNLTAGDLPLIQNRIALIEQLAPNAADPVNAAAFKEAYKDLLNMRERVTRPPRPVQ